MDTPSPAGSPAGPHDGRFEVVWPLGPSAVAPLDVPERPADLSGRRIGFVWDYVFRGDEMFDLIARAVRERYDGVEFVPYGEFGNVHGNVAEEEDAVARLPERLRELEVDLAVVGVGA